jgi:hypothetical protein
MSLFTNVDIALLVAEWSTDGDNLCCAVCGRWAPGEKNVMSDYLGHAPGCEMDLGLSERGFATQIERERARQLIALAEDDTLPPAAP